MSVPPTPEKSPLLVEADLKWYFSGGTFNSDPKESTGGEISATEYVSGTINGLFDKVETNEAINGDDEYRCVYLKNTHVDRFLLGAKVWIESGTPSDKTAIQISVGAGGTNGQELKIPNENVQPTTNTFESILEEPTIANIGDLGPGDYIAVWIRYNIQPGTPSIGQEVSVLRVDGEREPEEQQPVPPVVCGPGTHYNPATNTCVPDPITCPPNTHYNPATNTCIPDVVIPPGGDPVPPSCPTNYHYDSTLNMCVPNSGTPSTVPNFEFAASGDFDCVNDTDETFAMVQQQMVTTGTVDQMGIYLIVGDFSYNDNDQSCFIDLCESLGSPFFPNQYFPVIGNHDDEEDGTAAARTQIINAFPNIPSEGWYAFTRANIRFIGIDTQKSYSSGSAQHTFIVNELQAAAGNAAIKWKVLFYHKPSLISDTTHEALTDFRSLYHPLFDTYKVDVIITGHAHIYFRSHPCKHNSADPELPLVQSTGTNGVYDNIDGRTFITVGTGGRRSNHTFSGDDEEYVAMRANTFFGSIFCNLSNNGTQLKIDFIENGGTTVDTCTLIKPGSGGSGPPVTPTCPVGYHLNTTTDMCDPDEGPPTEEPPPPPVFPVLKIGFVGDTDGSVYEDIFDDMATKGIHQFCHIGDVSYNDSPENITDAMTATFTTSVVSNATVCLGNHDHPNEDGSQGNLDHLIDFFNLNVASEYCTKKQIQNVYLISMNTQDTNVEVNGGTQHLFVQAALAEAAAAKAAGEVDWIIVTVHKPLICASSDHPADEEGARSLYQAMFNSNQVDFVVSGHNHLLEISHPLSAPTTQQFTETDEGYDFRQAHGQIYMLSGGGGRTRDSHTGVEDEFRYQEDGSYGYHMITIDETGKNATVNVFSSTGTSLHEFVVTKGTVVVPPPPPTCPAGQHRDPITGLCVPNTNPPGTGGQVDSLGIRWFTATGQQGLIEQSRDEATDDRWSGNVSGIGQYGYETTMILTFNGTNSSSHFAMKHWGPNHSGGCGHSEGGSCCCWYDTGIRVDGEVQLQIERPHPSNDDFTLPSSQQFITNIGEGMEGNTIGLKWCIHPVTPGGDVDNGGIRLRMWVDTDGLIGSLPANNWRLVYDFVDTGQVLDGMPSLDEQDFEIRNSDTDEQTAYGGGFHYRKRTAADVNK